MALYNNVPSFTYIHATGISVVWNKTLYMVRDFSTDKKYVYWSSVTPNQLNASDVMPDRSQLQQLVLFNDHGIATIVPPTIDEFSIAFDGNSEKAIKERIYGLYEKNEENGNRFVTIEQDINGIKQIVGNSGEGQDGTLVDRVSKVEQKADELDLSVKENSKKYNDDKETNQLREDLNSSIIKINSNLGTFKSELTGYFNNNVITADELVQITLQLELLLNCKVSVDGFVDKVIAIANSNNLTQDVVALQSAKDALNIAHVNLVNNVNNACLDKIITPTEITIVIDAFAKYSQRVNTLKGTCDNVIILGMGGVITEELSNINMKADALQLSVSKVESSFSSDSSVAKIEIDKQISDYLLSLDKFQVMVKTCTADGIVVNDELILIDEKITNLFKEKDDVDSLYKLYSEDALITQSVLDVLILTYKTFTSNHRILIDNVKSIVSDGFVNDAEVIQIDTLFKNCLNAVNNLCDQLKKSVDNIVFNKNNLELENAKKNIQNQINDMYDSVDALNGFLNSTFDNNAIDEIERLNISKNIIAFESSKAVLDNKYNDLYNSNYLTIDEKNQLAQSKSNYEAMYLNIVNVVNQILNKQSLIDDIDRANMDSAIIKHKENIYLYKDILIQYINLIGQNRVKYDENNMSTKKAELKTEIDDLIVLINNYTSDLILSNEEKTQIREKLNLITISKDFLNTYYNYIFNNDDISVDYKYGVTSAYQEFTKSIDDVFNKAESLLSLIDISPSDIEVNTINSNDVIVHINAFIQRYCIAIDTIIKPKLIVYQSVIDTVVLDVLTKSNDIGKTMDGVFQDCILNEGEKLSLKQILRNLSSEKSDIDKQYHTLNADVDLIGNPKTELTDSYNEYVTIYNTLISAINDILNKGTLINETDRNSLDNKHTDHDLKLGIYSAKANAAVGAIAKKKAENESEKVDKKYAEILLTPDGIVSKVENTVTELNSLTGEVSKNTQNISLIDQKADNINLSVQGKVDGESIISAINLSKETIKISSSKISIEGVVTFSNLTDGTTTISGSNIRTGVIQGIRVEAMSGGSGCVMDDGGLQFYDWLNWWDGTLCGKISFDKYGSGVDSPERLWIRTTNGYAMKLQSSGDMSLEAGYAGQGTGTVWITKAQIDTLVCRTQQVSNIIAKFG